MPIPLNGKRVDQPLLQTEMVAAGVDVGRGLMLSGEDQDQVVQRYDHDGLIADFLPAQMPQATAVVSVHVAPPLVTEFVGEQPVSAIIRTTDDVPLTVFTFPCDQHRIYRADLVISGIDAVSFASKDMGGRFAWKRIAGNALMIGGSGIVVLWDLHDTAAASWAPNALPSGTNVVFSVKGAAGRTIDWLLKGQVEVYAPGGLAT